MRWDGTRAPWQWIYALGRDNSRYLFITPYNGDGLLRTAVTSGGGGAELSHPEKVRQSVAPKTGTTYASQTWPDVVLRSAYAPVIGRVTVAPYSGTA